MPASGALNALTKLFYENLSRHPTGKPVFIETWEHGRAWHYGQSENGTGKYEVVTRPIRWPDSTDPYYFPRSPQCFNSKSMCRLVTSGIDNGFSRMFWRSAPLPSDRIGFEINWALMPRTDQYEIMDRFYAIFLVRYYETCRRQISIYFEPFLDRLYFGHADVGELLLSNVYTTHYHKSRNYLVWENLKLIVDFDRAVAEKLYYNEREFDLTQYGNIGDLAATNNPMLNFRVGVNDRVTGTVQGEVYLGNIIITIEEE